MTPTVYPCVVLENTPLAPWIRRLRLHAPGFPAWRAGQFVTLALTRPSGGQVQRAYSLRAAPASDEIELWVERHEGGLAGPWLCGREAGDQVDLSGPKGGFGLLPAPQRGGKALFIGEVTGIVPLIGMAADWALTQPQGRARLLLSHPRRELDLGPALVGQGVTISRSALGDDATAREIDETVHEARDRLGERLGSGLELYVAGGGTTIAAVWEAASRHGVPRGRVRQEKFW